MNDGSNQKMEVEEGIADTVISSIKRMLSGKLLSLRSSRFSSHLVLLVSNMLSLTFRGGAGSDPDCIGGTGRWIWCGASSGSSIPLTGSEKWSMAKKLKKRGTATIINLV